MVAPTDLHVGDRVAVRVGQQEFDAQVVEVYGAGPRARVRVSFPLDFDVSDGEPSTVSLPASAVERAYA